MVADHGQGERVLDDFSLEAIGFSAQAVEVAPTLRSLICMYGIMSRSLIVTESRVYLCTCMSMVQIACNALAPHKSCEDGWARRAYLKKILDGEVVEPELRHELDGHGRILREATDELREAGCRQTW